MKWSGTYLIQTKNHEKYQRKYSVKLSAVTSLQGHSKSTSKSMKEKLSRAKRLFAAFSQQNCRCQTASATAQNSKRVLRAHCYKTLQGPPYILERFSSCLGFYCLSKGTIKQMVYQLKALIQSSLNQERNWAWHHPEGGHAQLIEKALLLLKLVLSLS